MVPPALGKLMVFAIGTSMWIWMQAYVKLQIAWYGRSVITPANRTLPGEFGNETFGTHSYVDVNNITVHFMMKGCDENETRPMLILLHGFLDFWFIWNRQIAPLGEKFCVVAPDLRGYGNTTRPADTAQYLMKVLIQDVKELIEQQNPNKTRDVVLVGHDWGGMISFCFATLHEDLINKMVIINGMHPKAFSKQLFRSVRQMKMSWYMLPFRHRTVPEQYLLLHDLAFFNKVHKGFTYREEYAHKYVFSQEDALTGAVNYYRAFNNNPNQLSELPYRKINKTTLILWAQEDEFITTKVAEYNQEWLVNSSVVYYEGAGHWLLRECSERVTHQILNFASENGGLPVLENFRATPEKRHSKCAERKTPRRKSRLLTLPWIPRNAKLPKTMAE